MREVLISIQPKWVKKIVRGEKTVEVRKTKPKCEVPFKCYIYCTKGNPTFTQSAFCDDISNGKVIGEFVCYRISGGSGEYAIYHTAGTCLTPTEIADYIGDKYAYYWHITDLVVYDEPRELSEFAKSAKTAYDDDGYLLCDGCEFANWNIERVCTIDFCPERMITRPPKSWQFCVATEPRQTAD